jgi:hypothetical protein
MLTGDVIDVRGTPDVEVRYKEVEPYLPPQMRGYKQ